jgi:hypothetical protein
MATYEYQKYEPIEPGNYLAKIIQIEDVSGQFGDQHRFTFELAPDEEGESRTLLGWCSAKFSSKSKLGEWVRAILFNNGEIPTGFKLDTDKLIGKSVRLLVSADEDKDGTITNKIAQIFPVKKKQKPAEIITELGYQDEEPDQEEAAY